MQRNVLGGELMPCSHRPAHRLLPHGVLREPRRRPGHARRVLPGDRRVPRVRGRHGNDLSTPVPEYGFAGLVPGDQWCVCAARWAEALTHGMACPVVLESTHVSALEFVGLDDLRAHAVS